MGKRKRLGLEVDVWALFTPDGALLYGDYRPFIYWTRLQAKAARVDHPHCSVGRVRIVLQ